MHHPISTLVTLAALAAVALLGGLSACDPPPPAPPLIPPPDPGPDAPPDPGVPERDPDRPVAPEPFPPAPTVLPAAARIVAIGDVHGDIEAARAALRAADVVDANGRWIGGDAVVVQVGDQTDRGDSERAILDWFERLRFEAAAAGGGFHPLIGNHETMNVDGNFAYVTAGGWAEFADVPGDPPPAAGPIDPAYRGRMAAFRPGGPYADLLSHHNMVLVVGETVFVHGGLLPGHVEYGLEAMNTDVRAWMRGEREAPVILAGGGPLWVRNYSNATTPADCALLQQALDAIPARRMVVAHTVQDGINSECGGMVWRVDVGLSAYYGGPTEALEITPDGARILRAMP